MQKQNISVNLEDLGPVKKKIHVVIPSEEVKREISSAYQSLRSTAVVAGFRKGAVPLNILKARFGEHVAKDVTTRLIESSYPQVLNDRNLRPVEAPHFDLETPLAEEGKEFSYSMTFEVTPEVDITGYIGMELRKEKTEVTEKDVEEGLNRLRESKAEFREVERGGQEEDLILVDFEGFLGGEPIKNSKTADFPIVIGKVTPLPGIDEAVKGTKKGETREAKVTFPENYSEASLSGKEATFKVTVKSVKEKVLPAVDDEFARDLGQEDLGRLREKVRADLSKIKEDNEKERLKNEILTKLIEKHPFEVPEGLVRKYLGVILSRVIDNMRAGMVAPEDRGLNLDQLKAKYGPVAARHVKEDVILDHIAAREKVEISREEFESAVRHLADGRGISFDSLISRIEREGAAEVIKDGLKHEKVFDIIIGASKTAA